VPGSSYFGRERGDRQTDHGPRPGSAPPTCLVPRRARHDANAGFQLSVVAGLNGGIIVGGFFRPATAEPRAACISAKSAPMPSTTHPLAWIRPTGKHLRFRRIRRCSPYSATVRRQRNHEFPATQPARRHQGRRRRPRSTFQQRRALAGHGIFDRHDAHISFRGPRRIVFGRHSLHA
jgi:hypothetical protein